MPVGRRQPQGGWRGASLRGALMVDATRGSLRVRSWPKKRPGPRHPTNEFWTMWLKAATYLYRYQPASVQWELQQATKSTVYMPRDLFISAARGRAFLLQDELGRKYYPMAFRQDVSDSLDSIGQLPGMMLARGTDLWVPIQPGSPGQLLRYVDDDNPPEWSSSGLGALMVIPIVIGLGSDLLFNVNSTSYVINKRRSFAIDLDEFPFTHYRVMVRAFVNAVGQTVNVSLRNVTAPTTPLGATADDTTVGLSATDEDSGWIARTEVATGLQQYGIAWKGSNSTVDITVSNISVELKA
jgi:hypothetical protein